MRVVAGAYGGRKLIVPKGRDVRPTSDKVRGAIFNALGGVLDFEGLHVLDVFCGTGALGVEALSRGAAHCYFVDKALASLNLAKENVVKLGLEPQASFSIGDARKVHLKVFEPFDLVFLDPPYSQDLIMPSLKHLVDQDFLSDGAICVLESEKGLRLNLDGCFTFIKDKLYGDTLVTFLRYKKSVV